MIPSFNNLSASALSMAMLLLGACAQTSSINEAATKPQEAKLLAVDLHRDHGWAAIRAERFDEAGTYFKRILQERGDDAEAMLGLGEAMLGQHRLDDAEAEFVRVGEGDDEQLKARALQGQAIVLLRRGQHEQAGTLLNEAVALDATLWRAWNGLGRVHDADKDYTAARYAYRQAIALNPDVALLHNNLGFSLLASGDPAFAESAFTRALDIDPALGVANANLRLALALQGRYGPALAGTAMTERARVMNNVGYAALLRGDLDKARSLFLDAMEADPGFFKEARRNLAYLETLEAGRLIEP